ncbi:UDP-N-acetylmuramoylalanine-D-glutamate ligase [Propionibacterium sp. oral taxon 192 str. F0372]|uniref:UDP-N-acetylmuramoyl-L-alanine--D-glutamate ligase n=1 Tax=Propionibacterium sp. oral taxon 192 TaxID=671222 RepID=UPI000352D1C8|nr:UDP-N-acetylmuramoyl-L-alanine--D-glutamate ligase [Propionibacterium sp. oral taxon 192]EPH02615.1 UDP-N-acetylmuramoylalanine-D-glutamate ligase [Propionibacterium sp. oral taxon 192 str. F0372]
MADLDWLTNADRRSPWPQVKAVVAGIGSAGFAAADALLELGAQVTVLDDSDSDANADRGGLLESLDATVRLGEGASTSLPADADLLIVSPGWRPDQPLVAQALAKRLEVWGDVELAWRLMFPDRVVPWLGITGTNGKTTTTQMLESMLRADGLTVSAVGNIGRPIIEALNDEFAYDVLAVELSSFQLHWAPSLRLHSAVVLNLHPDHLEWYGPWTGEDLAMQGYQDDKARIYHQVSQACIYNVAEPLTEEMVAQADVVEGARAIGFTYGIPAVSMLGVVDDVLADRAFIPQRHSSALPLAQLSDVQPQAPHNVENALAAAGLGRSFGIRPAAVAKGLRDLHLGGHRIATVAEVGGVRWIDDSKATNPHAANSSMRAFDSIVWIAGGQAKGTSFDDLIAAHAGKLRGAIVLGADRVMIAETLRHLAPEVPVVVVDTTEPRAAMTEAVAAAAGLAAVGDTVLLAPGCASRDMWTGYDARGDDFAAAVQALGGVR